MKVVDKMLDWENAGKLKLLSVGYSLREPQLLFRKIEDEEITAQIEKLKSGLFFPHIVPICDYYISWIPNRRDFSYPHAI